MNDRPKAGLLPLYLKLYDDTWPDLREGFAPFLQAVHDHFTAQGIDVVRAEPCRVGREFRAAVSRFEKADADLIITLHLAYSPSLESVDALATTRLRLLMLDTTMDFDFGPGVQPDRIMFNHGIHGVQDLAALLRRKGKAFEIVAGHVTESDVLDRAAGIARAAYAARCVKDCRVLRMGNSFKGMGDFAVSNDVLWDQLGVTVTQASASSLAADVEQVFDADVDAEMCLDRQRFDVDVSEETHRRSVRVGLGLRRMLEKGGYAAFSMNFLAFDSSEAPVDTVPFLEASKAMARGIGYAGEGDVLTAALVAALAKAFGRTTFTEIFCPDWKGGSLFLSHMGEINPEVAGEKPRLCEKDFPWTPAKNPAIIACAPKPGSATLVNLAPGPADTFRLILSPVEVLEDAATPAMRDTIRGWIRPACPLEHFLEQYSIYGGTHHSALMLGRHVEAVTAFATFMGIEAKVI